MLFGVTYEPRPGGGEQRQERALQAYNEWTPPESVTFHAHYVRADGNGGILIADAETAGAVAEATATFSPFFEFEVFPVVEVDEAISIIKRGMEQREALR